MNVDEFHEKGHDAITIFHNGHGLIKYNIVERVQEVFSNLIEDGEIIVGKLPMNQPIAEIEFSEFVENIICYSYVRYILKEKLK